MMRPQEFRLVVHQSVDELIQKALLDRCRGVEIAPAPYGPGTLLSFTRIAPTLTDAVVAGVRDLDAIGVRTASVFDDDLVTIATVAARVRRTPETVRLWAVGRTGPGAFPPPAGVQDGTVYYRWSEIAPWLQERVGVAVHDPAPMVTAVNLALRLRALAPRVPRMELVRGLIAG